MVVGAPDWDLAGGCWEAGLDLVVVDLGLADLGLVVVDWGSEAMVKAMVFAMAMVRVSWPL